MNDVTILHLMSGIRLGVAVTWSVIMLIGIPCLVAVVIGRWTKHDLLWGSLGLAGFGLLILQWRALSGALPQAPDKPAVIALLSIFLSGIGLLVMHSHRAEDTHRRMVLLCHLTIVFIAIVVGTLS